jgi:hypothetical protein
VLKAISTRSHKITSFETRRIYRCIKTLPEADHVARVRFCNWFCEAVFSFEIDPLLTYFPDEVWFYLKGHFNNQDSRYWSLDNPKVMNEVPLRNITVGV